MAVTRRRATQWLRKPSLLAAVAIVSLVAACHLWVNSSNPPGFHQDEAAIATNAFSIAETGRDENGDWMPLFFRSYGDYKSPEFVYLLAGVFRITGPSQVVARGLAAVLVLAAVAALAVLAHRRSARGLRRRGDVPTGRYDRLAVRDGPPRLGGHPGAAAARVAAPAGRAVPA